MIKCMIFSICKFIITYIKHLIRRGGLFQRNFYWGPKVFLKMNKLGIQKGEKFRRIHITFMFFRESKRILGFISSHMYVFPNCFLLPISVFWSLNKRWYFCTNWYYQTLCDSYNYMIQKGKYVRISIIQKYRHIS